MPSIVPTGGMWASAILNAATTGGGTSAPSGVALNVPYAANVTLDCSANSVFNVGALTGNCNITMINAVEGQKIEVSVIQDDIGGRVVTWNANVKYGDDITAVNSASAKTAGKTDVYGFRYRASPSAYRMVAFAKGY